MPLATAFFAVLRRDLLLGMRNRGDITAPIFFFVLVIVLFPLGVGASPALLQSIAAGVIFVAALLAVMLSLDGLFRSDFADGSLEQMALSPHPLSVLLLAKVVAHWLLTGVPLLLVAPLLAIFLGLPGPALGVLLLSLSLATPVLSLLGAIASALTVGLRRGGILLALLVLPLYIPVLIFATGAVQMAADGLPASAQINILLAMFFASLVLAPLPTAAAVKIAVSMQ